MSHRKNPLHTLVGGGGADAVLRILPGNQRVHPLQSLPS